MALLRFSNFATTTLAGPLTSTSTTCNVAAGSGTLFPQPGNGQLFKLVFQDAATATKREIVHVTAVSGDTFTITRGQEGTTQATWLAGDQVFNGVTAGTFDAFAQLGSLPSNFVQGMDGGTSANTVIVDGTQTSPAVSAPSVGQVFLVTKSSKSNTGAVTFQIGAGGTAYSVVFKDGTALPPNEWPAGSAAFLYFTGGVMQYVANQGTSSLRFATAADTGTADAMVVNPAPLVAALTDGVGLVFKKGTSGNATTTPTLAVSGLAAAPVVRADGTALAPGDLPAGYEIPVKYDAATGAFRLLWPVTPTQVQRSVPNPTVYVRTDGSDSNDGSANTPAKAFATILGAAMTANQLYSFATLNIVLGVPGTYGAIGSLPRGSGTIAISTAGGGTYTISGAGGTGTGVNNILGAATISGVTLQNTGSGSPTLACTTGGSVTVFGVTFTATVANGNPHMLSTGGLIQVASGCSQAGNMGQFMNSTGGGAQIAIAPNVTFTFTGNPSFSNPCFNASNGGYIVLNGGYAFSGTVSGTAYNLNSFAIFNTNGVKVLPSGLTGGSTGTSPNIGLYL